MSAAQGPQVSRYRLQSQRGVVGLGVVFEAVDPDLSREQARRELAGLRERSGRRTPFTSP